MMHMSVGFAQTLTYVSVGKMKGVDEIIMQVRRDDEHEFILCYAA